MNVKYLILGAGPAGLTAANQLLLRGEKSFLVLEQEQEAGGLCRSLMIDDSALDIGGGHFLDIRHPEVTKFLFTFMPQEEWNLFNRDSRIDMSGEVISHPIEANIWQMDIDKQIKYLKSIAVAGCNIEHPIPEDFVEWIYWKLGKQIAENYMIPYNQKIFSKNLNELGIYWLDKLPNVSFEETLLSCIQKRAYGEQPGHAQFYYPKKYGYGELWKRMAERIKDHIIYDLYAENIDIVKKIVNEKYQAEQIITTVPWTSFKKITGVPQKLLDKIKELKYSSIQVEYINENLNTDAHWIYYPDEKLPYHRILVRHNFCQNSSGYWTETNTERVIPGTHNYHYINKYAYPLNTINKPQIMDELLELAKNNNVYGLGRWGEWQHYNSDVTVARAMKLIEFICARYH